MFLMMTEASSPRFSGAGPRAAWRRGPSRMGGRHMCVWWSRICIGVCVYIYIYIYMYTHMYTDRQRQDLAHLRPDSGRDLTGKEPVRFDVYYYLTLLVVVLMLLLLLRVIDVIIVSVPDCSRTNRFGSVRFGQLVVPARREDLASRPCQSLRQGGRRES